MKSVKIIKAIITGFYLIASCWITFLVFERNFVHAKMQFSPDSQYENTLMILLVATMFSAVGVFLMGLLSMFTHFVFIKLIFSDEIKRAAFLYLKRERTKLKVETELTNSDEQTMLKS